jgi:hypothetical protein
MSKREEKQVHKQIMKRLETKAAGKSYDNFPKLASEIKRTLKYSDFAQQTATVLSVYTYRLNSLYDPDESGTGAQPYGFDELMALFNYYRVEFANIEVQVCNTGTAPAMVALAPSILNTDPTSVNDVASMPLGQSALIPEEGDNKHTFRMRVDIRSFLGIKMNIDDNLIGTATSNPTRMLYLHVASEQVDTAAKKITAVVRIDYGTRFINPKQLTLS